MKNRKSLMAKLVAVYLRCTTKREYSIPEDVAFEKYQKLKAVGEKPYVLPKSVRFKSAVQKYSHDDVDVYVLNGNSTAGKMIFYFHGGGYARRPRVFHWKFVDKLAQNTGAKVIFPLYPLAPFFTYRDMYEKMVSLYNKCLNDHPNDEIIFVGDSSGGGFSLAFYEYLIEHKMRLPNKTVAISPWVDAKMENPAIVPLLKIDPMVALPVEKVRMSFWSNGENLQNYMLSPIYYEHIDKLKNVSIFVGTDEILYPDAVEFFKMIEHNENCTLTVAQRMNHCYPLYPIPEAKLALEQVVGYINGIYKSVKTWEPNKIRGMNYVFE